MLKSSDDDAFLRHEVERLMAAKDRAEIAWQESNAKWFEQQKALTMANDEAARLSEQRAELASRVDVLENELKSERDAATTVKDRVEILNATVRRLEEEAAVREEQQATEAKALHRDIIQLRQENRKLSLSDARARMRAKEKACLLSMQSTAACPFCLEVFNNPIVLIPCGHVLCSRCFRESNEARGLLVVGDSDNLVFGPNTCVAAASTTTDHGQKIHTATPQQSAVGESNMTVLAQPSMTEGNRHLMQRLRTATASGMLASPEKMEAVAYSAEQALAKPSKASGWYCDECALHGVVRIAACHRIHELIENVGFVHRTMQTVRDGVLNKAVIIDGDDHKPVELRDSSAAAAAGRGGGTDLEADAQTFLLDEE